MLDYILSAKPVIAEIPFYTEVIFQCFTQVYGVAVNNRVSVKHPLILSDVIVSDFSGMRIYAFKKTSVYCSKLNRREHK